MNLPVYHNAVWSSAFLRELILRSVNSVPLGAESVAWQGAQMKPQVQTVLALDPTKSMTDDILYLLVVSKDLSV